MLGKVEEELEPFYKLWNMISDFQASRKEWLHGSFLGALPPVSVRSCMCVGLKMLLPPTTNRAPMMHILLSIAFAVTMF